MSTSSSTPRTNASQPARTVTPAPAAAEPLYLAAPVKIHQPDLFDGDRKKLKSFLTQLDLYFGFNARQFSTPPDMILYASSYLRGQAFDWFETFVRNFLDNRNTPGDMNDETREIFESYEAFVRKIQRTFGDIDQERTAERRLQTLTQKGSAANYAAEFQQHSARTEWDDAALTAQFYRGLKDRVKDDIARGDRPEDLQEMIETAIRIDNRQYERSLEKGGSYKAPTFKKHHQHAYKTRKPYYGPQPMELDATHQAPHRGPLSPRDREHRMKNNLCLYCGKPGHKARECKSAQKKPQQKGKHGGRYLNATYGTAIPELEEPTKYEYPFDGIKREYAMLSQTACYEDACSTHLSEKEGAGWFPKQPKLRRRKDVSNPPRRTTSYGSWEDIWNSSSPPSPGNQDGWTVVELEDTFDGKGKAPDEEEQPTTSLEALDLERQVEHRELHHTSNSEN